MRNSIFPVPPTLYTIAFISKGTEEHKETVVCQFQVIDLTEM